MKRPLANLAKVEEDGPSVLLDYLLDVYPGPYAMLFAFLDESYRTDGQKVYCVSGVLYEHRVMRKLNRAWKKELDEIGIKYFHTVEYCHMTDQFEGKSRKEANELYKRLVAIHMKYSCGSVTAYSIPYAECDVFSRYQFKYSWYTVCAWFCMTGLLNMMHQRKRKPVPITFFIESGPKMGELRTLIEKEKAKWPIIGPNFGDKESHRALQSADIRAYEMVKRVHDLTDEPKRIRASLRKLVGKNHKYTILHDVLLQMKLCEPLLDVTRPSAEQPPARQ